MSNTEISNLIVGGDCNVTLQAMDRKVVFLEDQLYILTNYGIFNIRYQGARSGMIKQFKKKLKSSIIASY